MNDLKKQHEMLLDLLRVFDETCKKYNIRYYAIGGTLLGAVRHQGFIPWDDDIDVAVPRADYNKLIEAAKFEEPYSLTSMRNDKGSNIRYYRLRNNATTFIPLRYCIYDCNQGGFIDIFQLDKAPDDKQMARKQSDSIKRLIPVINYLARYDSDRVGTAGLHGTKKLAYYLMLPFFKTGLINGSKAYDRIDGISSKYQEESTEQVGLISSFPGEDRLVWKAADFEETINMPFENMIIPVPKGYDSILRKEYGDDYMTPKQVPSEHGETIFDPETPWTEYVAEHKEELMELWLKNRA